MVVYPRRLILIGNDGEGLHRVRYDEVSPFADGDRPYFITQVHSIRAIER